MPRVSPRFFRRAAATVGAGAAAGGLVYFVYRPRNLPGSAPPAVPPPLYGADGTFTLPQFPRTVPRAEHLAALRRSADAGDAGDAASTPYDMLVIGGGATGAGVALDAATRGLRVALVERDDFSSGTSSKSTKLVHGGVRYLEKAVWNLDYAQYQLVREALTERKYFLQTAPHLSSWLPIMLPLDRWWKLPYYWVGCKAYDLLAGSEGIESSYLLTRSKALAAFPMLKQDGLVGALVYYDGAHNDARMNVSLAVTAALYGATVANHAEVTGLTKDAAGRLTGAVVRDGLDAAAPPIAVRARCVVNCTGPFTDGIRKMDDPGCRDIVAPASGVHITLPGYFSPGQMGLIDPSTSDGRVVFFLPWQGNTIAGTTDDPAAVTRNPLPDDKAIEWILHEIRHYLSPDIPVRRGDVLAAWSGLRPLVKDPRAKNTESLVRNHLVDLAPGSGLLTCAGGKWTTYRQMAEECVDAAIAAFGLQPRPLPGGAGARVSGVPGGDDDAARLDGSCQTHRVRVVGAHGYSPTLFIHLIQHFGLETDVAKHLTESYGDRAWAVAALCRATARRFPVRGERLAPLYPFVDGEVRYGVRHEQAQTAVDVLARRTRLAFLNAQAALDALPRVIDIMADELHWDRRRQDAEWRDSVAFLESMGLPKPLLGATRRQVESGTLAFANTAEYNLYSRHDKPADTPADRPPQ